MQRHERRWNVYLETAILAIGFAMFVWMLLKDWARLVSP
jgi:hypothetical protein